MEQLNLKSVLWALWAPFPFKFIDCIRYYSQKQGPFLKNPFKHLITTFGWNPERDSLQRGWVPKLQQWKPCTHGLRTLKVRLNWGPWVCPVEKELKDGLVVPSFSSRGSHWKMQRQGGSSTFMKSADQQWGPSLPLQVLGLTAALTGCLSPGVIELRRNKQLILAFSFDALVHDWLAPLLWICSLMAETQLGKLLVTC